MEYFTPDQHREREKKITRLLHVIFPLLILFFMLIFFFGIIFI